MCLISFSRIKTSNVVHNDRSQFTDWLSALRWWALCVSNEQKIIEIDTEK
ncbi:hypothetical protein ECSTECC16502_2842 [Escherichia coli STEC_C165-02]|nr:hypothetical protein ECSTECC16502_2842 [Escherichia coli STEC_C165-02]